MPRRNVLSSPHLSDLKKHRRRVVLSKLFISIIGIAAILGLLSYVSRLNNLNINEVQIIGNKALDADTLKTSVQEGITGKYLWLFPKTNILYYPQNNIKKELQYKFKIIKDINLSIKNNKILEVSLTERVPAYTWCGAVLPANSAEKCYFLDENGYLFDEAPYFSGAVYFKFYGLAGLNIDNPIGYYFSKQNFKDLVSLKDTLIKIGVKPESIYLTEDGDIDVFLSRGPQSVTEPKIILKADADFQNVAENLQAALTTEPLKSKFKSKYSAFEYIDLRFGNKVYDKFLEKP